MEMVDDIWMDENEATNLASCLPHYSLCTLTFSVQGEKLRSMPASAAAKYSRKLDIYRRMLVTDICSMVYKSSWLSQSL